MAPDRNGAWVKRPALFPTGLWTGYQGDTEAILRAAMIRALEVSLDLAPPGHRRPDPRRRLRSHGSGRSTSTGSVRDPSSSAGSCGGRRTPGPRRSRHAAHRHAPADGYPLTSKITRPVDPTAPPYTSAEYASPPPPGTRHNRHGMWVIGHEDYTTHRRVLDRAGQQGPDRDAECRVVRGRREHRRHRRARGMGRRRPSRRPALREPVRD